LGWAADRLSTLEHGDEKEAIGNWVDGYVAIYSYSYPRGMLFFPLVGLLPILLLARSSVALGLTIGVELVLVVAAVRWKTYRVELGGAQSAQFGFSVGSHLRFRGWI
jgi:hypothetical protein